jgi:CRISPR/Cas system-associated endonuclease Cas1
MVEKFTGVGCPKVFFFSFEEFFKSFHFVTEIPMLNWFNALLDYGNYCCGYEIF